ncbi:hypothetical protein JDF658_23860 [Carboxydocella sp. JDF658]|nr:hypothetical protein JDF658_23860 [Carboxydocella sp. JDF658]
MDLEQLTFRVDMSYRQVVGYRKNKGQWDAQPIYALTYWYCDWHNYTSYCGFNSSKDWARMFKVLCSAAGQGR